MPSSITDFDTSANPHLCIVLPNPSVARPRCTMYLAYGRHTQEYTPYLYMYGIVGIVYMHV